MNNAVAHERLLDSVALCCIDGRCPTPVVASPGGSLGEFIVVAAALEASSSPLEEDEIEALMEEMLAQGSLLYHHSDVLHLRRLGLQAGKNGCELPYLLAEWQDWIENPPAGCRESLLEYWVQAGFVGCGHLAAMLKSPVAYGVRRGLVESTLRVFYRLLWKGHPKIRFEVFDGDHEEVCITMVPSCSSEEQGTWCMPVTPKSSSPRFVVHPDAARFVRSWMARVAYDTRRVSVPGVEEFVSTANRLAEQQLEATVKALAPSLVTIRTRPCGELAKKSA